MGLPGILKEMDGDQVAQLWAKGERKKVLDYVAQDVRTTIEVAFRVEKPGLLECTSGAGHRLRMPVTSWRPLLEAKSLPERPNPLEQRSEHTKWLVSQKEGKCSAKRAPAEQNFPRIWDLPAKVVKALIS